MLTSVVRVALTSGVASALPCEKLLLPRQRQCNIPKEGKDVEATLAARPRGSGTAVHTWLSVPLLLALNQQLLKAPFENNTWNENLKKAG